MANKTAGTGQHSHEVPSQKGTPVLMRDGNHKGTRVTRIEAGYLFQSLDHGGEAVTPRCVLSRLTDVSLDEGFFQGDAYACDLESPDGLALIGCEIDDDDVPGEILWDSAG
jgi:hypothetical protein